ncbi:hypothetical protein M0N77_13205 (plasmid) [Psychrobacter sp. AH5]|uniref:hypothetical protein n=1 Tax=Psychrobacter sp. AH5 TaxID=2937433 RepID=UPI00333E7F7F
MRSLTAMGNVLKTIGFVIAALIIIALVLVIVTILKNNQKNVEDEMGQQISIFLDNQAYQNYCDEEKFKCLDLSKLGKGIDVKLIQAEIIDNKYHYTGSNKEELFFKVMTAKLRERLPSPVEGQSELELRDYEINKNQTKYIFSANSEIDTEEREYIQKRKRTKEDYEEICEVMYNSKYQEANDTKAKIEFYDTDDNLLLEVSLTKETCA